MLKTVGEKQERDGVVPIFFFSFRYGAAERSTPPIDGFFPSPSVYVVAEPTLLLKALQTPMTQKK
jgi:hypothetical protein